MLKPLLPKGSITHYGHFRLLSDCGNPDFSKPPNHLSRSSTAKAFPWWLLHRATAWAPNHDCSRAAELPSSHPRRAAALPWHPRARCQRAVPCRCRSLMAHSPGAVPGERWLLWALPCPGNKQAAPLFWNLPAHASPVPASQICLAKRAPGERLLFPTHQPSQEGFSIDCISQRSLKVIPCASACSSWGTEWLECNAR